MFALGLQIASCDVAVHACAADLFVIGGCDLCLVFRPHLGIWDVLCKVYPLSYAVWLGLCYFDWTCLPRFGPGSRGWASGPAVVSKGLMV